MCEICQTAQRDGVTRRSALTFAASAVAAGVIGGPAKAAKKKSRQSLKTLSLPMPRSIV